MGKAFEKALVQERESILDIYRQIQFPRLAEDIIHSQIIPFATYSPWVEDEDFLIVYRLIKDSTLVDIYRCYELWKLVTQLCQVSGDILEVGVWKGGTGALLCKANEVSHFKGKTYLADTFNGVIKATDKDPVYRGGEHSDTTFNEVDTLMEYVRAQNYEILEGVFPENFPDLEIPLLKFCHIDVDTYLSAKDVFEYAWPRMVQGGMVVFDDYGFWTCEGVTKYFNSLVISNGIKIHNINGHGIIVKFKE
ncbi:MAG TPA: TylF/MycF/NovP-related O-methyltransferase [Sphingobacteriaceae bacterium]|nr:TylF/MycF/NovP-related O-methyltransferase [Sphingobacteriaceae bacterium]